MKTPEKEAWKWDPYKLDLEVQWSHTECSGAGEMFKNQRNKRRNKGRGMGR